jgi:FtsP/CotA-like multicopper oxidase with cupredoxin domain
MNRRDFLTSAAAAAIATRPSFAPKAMKPATELKGTQFKLSIEAVAHEIAPGIVIPTVGYNGMVPGPLLRMAEGKPVTVDVTNKTADADLVHWHGLAIDSIDDGAMEEGSPMIDPHKTLRYSFTPKPSGSRWYHTHAGAGASLTKSTYGGQYGFLYVEPAQDPNHYDREYFLQIHHWDASLVPMMLVPSSLSDDDDAPKPKGIEVTGCDVAYKHATVNGKKLGHGEPLRVKPNERVMLRILNASATQNVTLALPGHKFHVVAMDGNSVPKPAEVETLQIAVAERMDVIVEMNAPGVWALASVDDAERASGLGIVVEYAGQTGPPVWKAPATTPWDYTLFANAATKPDADRRFSILMKMVAPPAGSKMATWTLNGESWPKIAPLQVEKGKRYRLSFVNASTCAHPMHLHRHSFEVTRIGRKHVTGLMKDVINVPAGTIAEVDFIADNPGDTLMHCHQQLHMDYGFMQLIQYI